jgi:hypothetical protein
MSKHGFRRALSRLGAFLLHGFGQMAMEPISSRASLSEQRRDRSLQHTMLAVVGSLVLMATVATVGSGTAVATTDPIIGMESTASGNGYWLVNSFGGEISFGAAAYLAPTKCDPNFTGSVLGIAPTPDHLGFWEYDAAGQLACFGDAGFYGDLNGVRLDSPIVGMAATPDGKGYDLVAADGGIFAFGDAYFYGSEGGQSLSKPIAGVTEFPIGQSATSGGYWMFSTSGQVYPFGSAISYSRMNSRHPVIALASTADGHGYWMTESSGHVAHFGDAVDHGSTAAARNDPIVAMTATPNDGGYWEVDATGTVFPHGDAVSYGNA